jgi:small subunit ribosomal protein S21
MIEIVLYSNDRPEWGLKKFRWAVLRSGMFKDIKKHRYYVKPGERRRNKHKAAIRKQARSARGKRR